MINHDPSAEAERKYDHYDDVGEHDAATIRAMSGYETDGTNEDFTAAAIEARLGRVAMPNQARQAWVDSMHLTQPSSGGPLRHPTPEDGRFASEQVRRVKEQIHPTR